jgi:sec-independent protein translocase protein TatC
LFCGLILASPYIIWDIWNFIKPALNKKEKTNSKGAVLICTMLFLIGILFSYFIIVPLTLNFLGNYHVSNLVENNISLSSYINTIVSVTLSVGFVFETPVLIFFLTKVGIITPQLMRKNRKIVFVILLIVSAIITPPDAFSQILVCIPLIILYEISINISKKVYRKLKNS